MPSCSPSPDNALLELICHGLSFSFSRPKAGPAHEWKNKTPNSIKLIHDMRMKILEINGQHYLLLFSHLTMHLDNQFYWQKTKLVCDDFEYLDV